MPCTAGFVILLVDARNSPIWESARTGVSFNDNRRDLNKGITASFVFANRIHFWITNYTLTILASVFHADHERYHFVL